MKNLKFQDLGPYMEVIVQFNHQKMEWIDTEYGVQFEKTDIVKKCFAGTLTRISEDEIQLMGDVYQDENGIDRQDLYYIKYKDIIGIVENSYVVVLHDDHSGIHSKWFEDDFDTYLDEEIESYNECKQIESNSFYGTYSKALDRAISAIENADEVREFFEN